MGRGRWRRARRGGGGSGHEPQAQRQARGSHTRVAMGADAVLRVLLGYERPDDEGAAPLVRVDGAGQPWRRPLRHIEPALAAAASPPPAARGAGMAERQIRGWNGGTTGRKLGFFKPASSS